MKKKDLVKEREEGENEREKGLLIDEEEEERNEGVRKGQWTPEEDSKLSSYVAIHGQRNWNFLARLAGLKRSGKSCRLRWLNYLRPDLRQGNFTLKEQLLIFQLHFRWGNRWSKIAQELPGRTDNNIKNYWRTKVQKLAKHFNCDANSPQFRKDLCHTWIPRLVEQIRASQNSQSNFSPFYGGTRLGPQEPYNNPNISNLGYLFDPSYIQEPMDLPVEPKLKDPCNSCISSGSGSSASSLDYSQIWEQHSDILWDLQPAQPNMLPSTCDTHNSPNLGSSASSLDYNQTWEQNNDILWDLQAKDKPNMSTDTYDTHISPNSGSSASSLDYNDILRGYENAIRPGEPDMLDPYDIHISPGSGSSVDSLDYSNQTWDQNSDINFVGITYSQQPVHEPDMLTDPCHAHISPDSGLSDYNQTWEHSNYFLKK